MSLYMVIPSFAGDVTKATLPVQGKRKVRYRGYWVEVGGGEVLCLVEAPSAGSEAVNCEGGPSR